MKTTLLIFVMTLMGCLRLAPKPTTPQVVDCAALDNAYVGFTGTAIGLSGAATASGIVTASYDNPSIRVGMGVAAALAAAGGVVFTWVGAYEAQLHAAGGCGILPTAPLPTTTPATKTP